MVRLCNVNTSHVLQFISLRTTKAYAKKNSYLSGLFIHLRVQLTYFNFRISGISILRHECCNGGIMHSLLRECIIYNILYLRPLTHINMHVNTFIRNYNELFTAPVGRMFFSALHNGRK